MPLFGVREESVMLGEHKASGVRLVRERTTA